MNRNAAAFILILGLFLICTAIGAHVEPYFSALVFSAVVGVTGLIVGGVLIERTTPRE